MTLVLWQGRARAVGLVPALAAVLIWAQSDRPWLLIARDGTLAGVMTDEGRALSKPRGAGFAARLWIENDGDAATQDVAAARWTSALGLHHLSRKADLAAFSGCGDGDIVISLFALDADLRCFVIGPDVIEGAGAIDITLEGDGYVVRTSRALTGTRLWTEPARPPRQDQVATRKLP